MNNSPQQNDHLFEHGYDVRLGRAAPTEATLSVTPLSQDAQPILSATLYGPFCKFSNTLPYKIPLRAESNAPRWSATVPDVCYWTPNLPMHYRLTLQTADARQFTTWVALKRFGVKDTTLSMDGERYVIRGFSTRGLNLTASDEEAWKALREQRSVLVLEQLEDDLVQRAGWAGIPVIWDARAEKLTPEKLTAARALPALVGIMATESSIQGPDFLQAANDLIWIMPASHELSLEKVLDERTQVALLSYPSLQIKFSSNLPTIIGNPFTSNPILAERRKLCDELQASTTEFGSAAGYLLL